MTKHIGNPRVLLAAAAVLGGTLWCVRPIFSPALAQNTKQVLPSERTWVLLNNYVSEPPSPEWINLEKAERIQFDTGSFGTRRNVPQAVVSLARRSVTVLAPKEIDLLRRYVEQRKLR